MRNAAASLKRITTWFMNTKIGRFLLGVGAGVTSFLLIAFISIVILNILQPSRAIGIVVAAITLETSLILYGDFKVRKYFGLGMLAGILLIPFLVTLIFLCLPSDIFNM